MHSATASNILNTPVLIFGGPYSNLEATRAMQARAEALQIPPQQIICTGDTIAYCAAPEDTVTLIRNWGVHVVQGNCEEAIAEDAADCGCGFETGSLCSTLSTEWFEYARKRLDREHKQWMRSLPKQLRFRYRDKDIVVLHGDAYHNNTFVFGSDCPQQKAEQLRTLGADIVIGGHCGLPFGQLIGDRAWLNAGVIGMPANDGTRDGWYMLVKDAPSGQPGIEVSWHRLHYDWRGAQQRMSEAGLSPDYRLALETGQWPSESILPETEKSARAKALDPLPLSIASRSERVSP